MKKWNEEVTVTMTVDEWLGVVLALESEALDWTGEEAPVSEDLKRIANLINSHIS